jgi:hypothetical protein
MAAAPALEIFPTGTALDATAGGVGNIFIGAFDAHGPVRTGMPNKKLEE